MRKLNILAVAAASLLPLSGSILQQLSLNDMIEKSTLVVRGVVQPGTASALRGSMIYTHYQVQVSKIYKGSAAQSPAQTIDIAVPGGMLNGAQQAFAGSPALKAGQEYVLFLWTSKNGLTQVIGLSQGLFQVSTSAQGEVIVSRGAASEKLVDSSGQTVIDTNLQMPLAQLRNKIQTVLSPGTGQ
jgi:hypothetical protein